jgi:hypothetical protein
MDALAVRYDGPEQGLELLEHALYQGGLDIIGVERAGGDPTPVPTMVNVVYRVVDGAGRDDPDLPARVRRIVAAFARLYKQAGLDVEE